jgi:hypothetical protein
MYYHLGTTKKGIAKHNFHIKYERTGIIGQSGLRDIKNPPQPKAGRDL